MLFYFLEKLWGTQTEIIAVLLSRKIWRTESKIPVVSLLENIKNTQKEINAGKMISIIYFYLDLIDLVKCIDL